MANLRANNLTGTGGRNAIDGSVEFTSSTGYLSTTLDTIGTSDFTIEWWFKASDMSEPGTANRRMFRLGANNATGSISINYDAVNNDIQWNYNAANLFAASTIKVYDNSWYHIAAVREGTGSNETKLYINGVLSDTGTLSQDLTQTACEIGRDSGLSDDFGFYGNISNLRVTKSAVYTAAFTPPTEKYSGITDTILLCCQDFMNPEQEATGKTITGYGDLTVSDGVDLVTGTWTDVSSGSASASGSGKYVSAVGTDLSNRGAAYMPCTVVVGKNYEFGFRTVAGITNCKIGVDSNDGTDDQRDAVGNNPDLAYPVSADSTTITGRKYRDTFTATTTTADIYFQGINGTVTADEIFLRLVDNSDKWRSNNEFPSVGVDEGVTFNGDTKINSQGVMYFPTGDTSQRGRGRAVWGGGTTAPTSMNATIDYISIDVGGLAQDFGDLTANRNEVRAFSSTTRGVFGGGRYPHPSVTNIIDYVTLATTANATDFGDLTDERAGCAAVSNNTRGVFMSGFDPSNSNIMDYVTIPSTGNATDFGDSIGNYQAQGRAMSPTRGLAAGNYGANNLIEYITIATTGNSTDFGDMTVAGYSLTGTSSNTRGIFAGGEPGRTNVMDYVTIASTGNAADFGDLYQAVTASPAATSNSVRGVVGGGQISPALTNVMQMLTIATTGDTVRFGDLSVARAQLSATSDCHGGLS